MAAGLEELLMSSPKSKSMVSSYIIFFLICVGWPIVAIGDPELPVATEPLVVEFEFAGVRQEILATEASDFRVITDTPRGQLHASGRVGRVSQGRVDLVLKYYFDSHEGGGSGGTLKRDLVLGQFSSGSMSLPFSYFVRYIWVRRGVDPVPTLIEALHRRDLNPTSAARHLGGLGTAASRAVPDLIEIVKGNDTVKLRAAAAGALGQIGPKAEGAVPTLVRHLDDEQAGELRIAAAAAVWKITRHPEATPTLIAALSDGEKNLRMKALDVLREMGVEAPSAGPALLAMLHDGDAALRVAAASALWATTRDTRAVDTLIAILEGAPNGHARAGEALGRIGYPGARRATEALAADGFSSNSIQRWYVGKRLTQVDPDGSRSVTAMSKLLPHHGADAVEQASDVLARFGATVVPRLRELLDSDDERVRKLGFYTLWRIGSPAVGILAEALGHRNPQVRRRAAGWLRSMETDISPAVPYLIRALHDDAEEVRSEAALALVEIGAPAIAAVQHVLHSPDPQIRKLGEQILRDIEERERMETTQP